MVSAVGMVAAGEEHLIFTTAGNKLFGYGNNRNGQCGV
jgi:alpha-tubulin suppressor-like RCC1 family protein